MRVFRIWRQGLVFLMFFTLEIAWGQAETQALFSAHTIPKVVLNRNPIPAPSHRETKPFYFYWEESRWELAKGTVLAGRKGNHWRVAEGHFVLQAHNPQVIETPFAEIHLSDSSVFVELAKDRLVVSVIGGGLVTVKPRAHQEEHILAPGFTNWYGGVGPDGQKMGVPMVVDLKSYARKRAYFFTDHKVGFVHELKRLAGLIQYAGKIAAAMHRDLVYGKMALLQARYDAEVLRREKTTGLQPLPAYALPTQSKLRRSD